MKTHTLLVSAASVALASIAFLPLSSADETAKAASAPTQAAQPSNVPIGSLPNPGCVDTFEIAPVLTVTSAGGTLQGASLSTLIVYSNGLVAMSGMEGSPNSSSASMQVISRAAVEQLAGDLAALNAGSMCDSQIQVFDVPLTTISIHGGPSQLGQPTGRTHTFSYYIPDGPRGPISATIENFARSLVE